MYCREHSVKWRVGEKLFSTWRYETEEKWSENYELLKDFGEIEPHSSYLNNPSNETLQPCACDRCVAGVLSAISAAAKGR